LSSLSRKLDRARDTVDVVRGGHCATCAGVRICPRFAATQHTATFDCFNGRHSAADSTGRTDWAADCGADAISPTEEKKATDSNIFALTCRLGIRLRKEASYSIENTFISR
jgi:hypothetical protein